MKSFCQHYHRTLVSIFVAQREYQTRTHDMLSCQALVDTASRSPNYPRFYLFCFNPEEQDVLLIYQHRQVINDDKVEHINRDVRFLTAIFCYEALFNPTLFSNTKP